VDNLATRLHAEGRIKSTHASEPFDSRFARICEEDPSVSPDHLDEFLDIGWATARGETRGTFELMRCKRLIDLIAPILGTEEVGWSPISHVRAKLPGPTSNIAAWHQDAIFVTEDADEVRRGFVETPAFQIGRKFAAPALHRLLAFRGFPQFAHELVAPNRSSF
jgi:hypothetical protein